MVSFAGEGSGSGELTWGQQHIWGAMSALGEPMTMCATRVLTPDATVAECVDELRFYVSHFQSMRTLLTFPPDRAPVQVVVDAGEVPLEIVDAAVDEDPDVVCASLAKWHEDEPFDYEKEFPIRMSLLRQHGKLTHLVIALSHFATDGAGAYAMYLHYLNRDPQTGGAATPIGLQPLELAARQRTSGVIRQSDAALAYWREMLQRIPARRFRAPIETGLPRYWQVEVESAAMFRAVQTIANRVQVDASTVLLGVYAIALARVTGNNPSVLQMLISNRFRPGLAEMVSNISQTGLCVIDVADATIDEAMARTRRASMSAYKYAYFDLTAWKNLLAQMARERGDDHDLGYYYNDRPTTNQAPATAGDDAGGETPPTGPLRWTKLAYFNERLMLTINDAPDAVALMLLADTFYVPKTDMTALVREMETVALAAAADPNAGTDVTA
jgi:condensation domain-containing protein